MSKNLQTKVLNKIALEEFSKYGIFRYGNPKLWIDDQGWYLTIIEFQPFANGNAVRLNVGVNFNWFIKDHFSFDIGHRVDAEPVNVDDNDFELKISNFCNVAVEKALSFRKSFESMSSARDFMLSRHSGDNNPWTLYHLGIINGLCEGNIGNAYFEKLINLDSNIAWVINLKSHTVQLSREINFPDAIVNLIKEFRIVNKLPDIEVDLSRNAC